MHETHTSNGNGQGHKGHHGDKSVAKGAWNVTVDVYLHSEAAGDYTIESYLQSDPAAPNDLVFYNRKHPGFNVTFILHDETGLGYRFPGPPKKDDAIWSQLGPDACPGSGQWDIFPKSGIKVNGQGDEVTAFNPNPSPAQGAFGYALNVTKDNGAHYLPLDPGGNNQNGSF